MNKTTICVVVHNNLHLTKRCLELVFKHTKNFDLIVVDNASTDGTKQYLESLQDTGLAKVIYNVSNERFIRPNNNALRRAVTPYFCMLNNDVTVCEGWLEAMEAVLDTEVGVAAVGVKGTCCTIDADGKAYASDNVQYIEASCMLVRTGVALPDLFDERMRFGYFEDTDLGFRLRSMGYQLKLIPINVVHEGGQTAKQVTSLGSADIRGAWLHNRNVFYRKWANELPHSSFEDHILIRRAGAIGDVILTTPIVRELKYKYPKSTILYSTHCGSPLEGNPHIASVVYPEHNHRSARVVDLDKAYERMPDEHVIQAFAWSAGLKGLKGNWTPQLYPSSRAQCEAEDILDAKVPSYKGMCVMHTGMVSGWIGRQWDPERFDLLNAQLQRIGYFTALTGDQYTPSTRCDLDLRRRSFDFTMALIQRAHLFVGIDSAPFHVAQAFNVPSVVLFGSVSPERYIVPGGKVIPVQDQWLGCLGCHSSLPAPRTCTTECMRGAFDKYKEPCMDRVTVDHFMEAIQRAEQLKL